MADDRHELTEQVLAVLPDWVNTLSHLNALIAERMGVAASDLDGLHALHKHGPATASSLAERVGLTAGSVSRMIDRLDAAGCVERVRDPSDRRRVLIEPTPEGLERIADYYAGLTTRTHEDLDVFDDAELRSLARFMDRSRDSAAAEIARLRSGDRPARPGSGQPVSGQH